MLMNSDKLSSKNKETQVNEFTKNFTTLFARIQESDPSLKADIENLKIENANEIPCGGDKRCYLVQVNESSVKSLHNIHSEVVKKLEEHVSTPVVIVPYRKKINGKLFRKFRGNKVPRDKTLSAVYDSYLEDLLYPATIVGKRVRFPKGKSRVYKVFVDPIDRDTIDYKLNAIVSCYKGLTNRDLVVEFPQNA
jgi:small subunit ribosomal protein S7e